MKLYNVEGILFDSGRVLNSPRTGHWFISPGFYSQVDKLTVEQIDRGRVKQAFSLAAAYINSVPFIQTMEEEYMHFRRFYEIIAGELTELNLTEENINNLARDLVYNAEKYVFYEDALNIIPQLYSKYKLAVVSDAWPSLKKVFDHAALSTYFTSFVISSILGVTKPDEKMYLTALKELNITPDKALFIDDNRINCLAALRLGIHTALLCRDRRLYLLQRIRSIGKGYRVIRSLKELQ